MWLKSSSGCAVEVGGRAMAGKVLWLLDRAGCVIVQMKLACGYAVEVGLWAQKGQCVCCRGCATKVVRSRWACGGVTEVIMWLCCRVERVVEIPAWFCG